VRRGLDNVRVYSTELAELIDQPPITMEAFINARTEQAFDQHELRGTAQHH
jgi:hypothetical protein